MNMWPTLTYWVLLFRDHHQYTITITTSTRNARYAITRYNYAIRTPHRDQFTSKRYKCTMQVPPHDQVHDTHEYTTTTSWSVWSARVMVGGVDRDTLATSRGVSSLPIGQSIRSALENAGFYFVAELEGFAPVELAREAKLSKDEALVVLRSFGAVPAGRDGSARSRGGVSTAADLLQRERRARRVTTFCKELDDMLGGGVCAGEVTEFSGVPGVGKTQLGMQLAVDVQIPTQFGGASGRAIYVDTEGSFIVDRVVDMSDAMIAHLRRVAEAPHAQPHPSSELRRQMAASMSVDAVLQGIDYFRVHDYTEQIALIKHLDEFVERRNAEVPPEQGVKLVVIDSIAFHLRQEFGDIGQRTRILLELAQALQNLASRREIAVVVINQVTTKLYDGGEKSVLAPALGETWAHCPTTRVALTWEMDQRIARLTKSPSLVSRSAPYVVKEEGIRGLDAADLGRKRARLQDDATRNDTPSAAG